MVDVGLERNDSVLISAVGRESEEPWNDGELLTIGMSLAEVSKWVLKRINGFSKFLGVSFDGLEDRTNERCNYLRILKRSGGMKWGKM